MTGENPALPAPQFQNIFRSAPLATSVQGHTKAVPYYWSEVLVLAHLLDMGRRSYLHIR